MALSLEPGYVATKQKLGSWQMAMINIIGLVVGGMLLMQGILCELCGSSLSVLCLFVKNCNWINKKLIGEK